MSNRMWVSVAVVGALVACSSHPVSPGSAADPPRCTDTLPAGDIARVYVEVMSSPAGTVVLPEWCTVRSGTEVVWRMTADVRQTFELDFAESPGTLSGAYMRMAAGQKRFTSRQVGDRQELTIIAKPVVAASRIPYEVRIGDTLVDPGIKIMPR